MNPRSWRIWSPSNAVIAFFLLSASLGLLAVPYQVPRNQPFNLSPPEQKQFSLESIYNYTKRRLDPPVVIQKVSRLQATDTTPEGSFIAFMSAMETGDYEWWLSSWTTKSQEIISNRNQEMKRTPQDWATSWRAVLKDKQVVLLERLDTGPYVILVYSLHSAGPISQETFRSLYAAREEDGHWRATQELEKDPLFFHYLEGKDKVSLIIR